MANIKIVLDYTIIDGQPLSFKAPCDCTAVTGIKVEYPDGDSTTSAVFSFADAHGTVLTGIGNLFAKGAMVRVILDTVEKKAYIQNADTNSYIEETFVTHEALEEALADVGVDTLVSTSQAYLPPTEEDVEYCHEVMNGSVPYDSRYDVNGDGRVDATDMLDMFKAVRGSDDMSTWPNMEYSDVTVLVDPSNPDGVITIEGTNMWGSDVSLSFGLNTLLTIDRLVANEGTGGGSGGDSSEELTAHINNKENPHEVTAEQIGAVTQEHLDNYVTKEYFEQGVPSIVEDGIRLQMDAIVEEVIGNLPVYDGEVV